MKMNRCLSKTVATHRSWIAVLVALLTVVPAIQVQAQENAPIIVDVKVPAKVGFGEAFTLTLQVSGASDSIGGMEATTLFDPTAAEFAAFYPPATTAQTGVGTLIMPESPEGASVGFFTCTTPECHEV